MKKVYLFFTILTFLFLLGLGFVIWKLPPETDQGEIVWRNLIFFTVSLVFSISGILSFLIFGFRKLFFKVDSPRIIFRESLREGILVALFLLGILIFQKIEALTVFNLILWFLIFLITESFWLYKANLKSKSKKIQDGK